MTTQPFCLNLKESSHSLTTVGVNRGLQAGSSCCVNRESKIFKVFNVN